MSSSLASSLPLELYALIDKHLSFADQKSFASTCSQVRAALVPTIFSDLRLTNRLADYEAVKNVIEKHGRFVRKLSFRCHLCPSEVQKGRAASWTYSLLSGAVLNRVHTLVLSFVPQPDVFHYNTDWWFDPPDVKSGADGASKFDDTGEQSPSWQYVIDQVWSALSMSKTVLHLEIEELLPRQTSVWATEQWKCFVGKLQSLSISLWSCNDTSKWKSNTLSDYRGFQADLDAIFFDHADIITRLRICADYDSPYGCDGEYNVRMALFPQQMPQLECLELENCMIDPTLLEFLLSHSKQVKHLFLRDCSLGAENRLMNDSLCWGEFFERIRLSQPALERLEIKYTRVPITHYENVVTSKHPIRFPTTHYGHIVTSEHLDSQGKFIPPDDEDPNIKQARADVEAGKRNLFRYTDTRDKCGRTYENPLVNSYRYHQLYDQREFWDLMSIVHSNARAASSD